MTDQLPVSIQPLTKTDQTQVIALFERCITTVFEKENLSHMASLKKDEIHFKLSLIEDALNERQKGFRFWVAKQGSRIVGIISYGPCGPDIVACSKGALAQWGELGSLYVLPEFQNQGIGSALIQTVVQELARLGIERFVLDSGYRLAQTRWKKKFGMPWIEVLDYWGPNMPHCVWCCQTADFLEHGT